MTEPRTLQERLLERSTSWRFPAYAALDREVAATLNNQSEFIVRLEAANAHLRQLQAEAREALENLVTRLDAIHEDPAFKSVWVVNQLHAGPYTGPKYETEWNKARAVLAKLTAASAAQRVSENQRHSPN